MDPNTQCFACGWVWHVAPKNRPAQVCPACGSRDVHDDAEDLGGDDDEQRSGYCEDFPCCGHEAGDCFGQKYGSDESIKQRVYERMDDDFDLVGEPEGWW